VTGAPITTLHGTTLGANDYVQNWGAWIVEKRIKALTGDVSISKEIAGHELTVGYYGTSYSSDDHWSLGNFRPMQVAEWRLSGQCHLRQPCHGGVGFGVLGLCHSGCGHGQGECRLHRRHLAHHRCVEV
jgi:hypothetical protein